MTRLTTLGALLLIAGTVIVIAQAITSPGTPARVGLVLAAIGVSVLLFDALAQFIRGGH